MGLEADSIDQTAMGAATALLGGGAALTAAGIVFDGGLSTALQIVGAAVIVVGAILLGKAIARSRSAAESSDPT